jgi:hypothetical protein
MSTNIYKNHSEKKKSFKFFKYTGNSMNDCCIAMDSPDYADASDAQRGDLCCRQCQWFGWPFTFIFDIVTIIPRGIHHIVTVKCKGKKSKKN